MSNETLEAAESKAFTKASVLSARTHVDYTISAQYISNISYNLRSGYIASINVDNKSI